MLGNMVSKHLRYSISSKANVTYSTPLEVKWLMLLVTNQVTLSQHTF